MATLDGMSKGHLVSERSTASNQLRRGGLGRGLDSLIPPSASREHGEVSMAALDAIQPNPYQPRTEWDDERLTELAESIRTHGLIQPLIVSLGRIPETYILIAGERRLRAARLAGLESVPIVIKDVSPQSLLELALVENLVRSDLSPLEEAHAYQQLKEEFGLTQAAIADRVGRSRVSVTNTLRLLNLPPDIQHALAGGVISEGHARSLLALESAIDQAAVLQEIVAKGLSVRQTEDLVRTWTQKKPVGIRRIHEDDRSSWELAERLQRSLGTKVGIKRDAVSGQGSISIHFFDDEQLSALLARLGLVDDF